MELQIKKLSPAAKLPTRAHSDDAGLDVYAAEEYVLKPGERRGVKTGFALAIPTGYVGLVWDKGSVGVKAGIKTLGGVVDAAYRGELLIGMVNLSEEDYPIHSGHKIAQLLIQKVEFPEVCEVAELGDTIRGEGGFGSTGAA